MLATARRIGAKPGTYQSVPKVSVTKRKSTTPMRAASPALNAGIALGARYGAGEVSIRPIGSGTVALSCVKSEDASPTDGSVAAEYWPQVPVGTDLTSNAALVHPPMIFLLVVSMMVTDISDMISVLTCIGRENMPVLVGCGPPLRTGTSAPAPSSSGLRAAATEA
jgi:hypothetical protein